MPSFGSLMTSKQSTVDIRLGDILAPSFHDVHRAIKNHEYIHYWLKGGRGSTKSSFAAIEVILSLMRDPDINAVVLRKVGNTMRDSVYAQIMWAVDILGASADFHGRLNPMEIIYRPTGQRILFRGADKPEKLKSLKTQTGYIGVVWVEELDQFYGMSEIRNILQSLMRGGEHFTVMYSYNPPKSRDSWANKESMHGRDDRLVHTSTYLEVPRKWLGETFIAEAEELKSHKPDAYAHEYMGDVTGTGGAVFENLTIREITDEEVSQFDRIHNGVDWGYFPDPWVFGRMHFDAGRKTLYLFDEAATVRMGNTETANIVKEHLTYVGTQPNYKAGTPKPSYHRELVICDSAEPKSIADYRRLDVDARPARKGPGSVEHGMKWLQSLDEIVVDPKRCPLASQEFSLYEYERNREGEYVSGFPDSNNHWIDLCRYAMSPAIRRV